MHWCAALILCFFGVFVVDVDESERCRFAEVLVGVCLVLMVTVAFSLSLF